MWHVDSTHTTFIATGNGGSEPTTAEATIFYNGGQSKYRVEKMLSPGQQLWIDLGHLIRDQVPDSDGHTMPPDTMTGSYELRDLDHANVGQLYEGKLVVDKTYGHAAYGCGDCCGLTIPVMVPDSYSGPPDNSYDEVIQCTEQCGGEVVDVADEASDWQSSNTAVATLPTSTLHTVASGTANGSAQIKLQATHPAPQCPIVTYNPFQPVAVCDFTIAPANVVAQNCAGSSQNSNNFATTITPAGNSCLADQTKSTCSEAITEGSNIDFAVGSPKCVFNLGNPSATVTYYAGPALPNGTAGGISMTFNLVFGGTSDSHTDNATVECPQ